MGVEDLATAFDVTVQTIRRDLTELCEAGLLARTHGGAMLPSGVTNIAYEERRRLSADAKEAIGQAAAALIPAGASLFLNIGTTTEAVARALADTPNLMVVTNNLNVAQIMGTHPTAEVILTGGRLRRADGGLTGDMAVETIRQFKVDIAVIGALGPWNGRQHIAQSVDPDEVTTSAEQMPVTGAHEREREAREMLVRRIKGKHAAPQQTTRAEIACLRAISTVWMTISGPRPTACAQIWRRIAGSRSRIASIGQKLRRGG